MDFFETVRTLCKSRGTTVKQLEKDLGFSNGSLRKGMPNAGRLYKLARYFDVPMETFFDEVNAETIRRQEEVIRTAIELQERMDKEPVYELSAGQGAYNDTYASEYTDTETPDECSWCRVHGDSMYPILHDGDMVLVHHQSETNAKDLSVVKINGDECTCKYVEITDKGIWLRAENKEVFEDRFYSIQEVLTLPISVIGKVVRMQRSFL